MGLADRSRELLGRGQGCPWGTMEAVLGRGLLAAETNFSVVKQAAKMEGERESFGHKGQGLSQQSRVPAWGTAGRRPSLCGDV